MKIEYRKHYSHHLGRDMEYKVYGHAGKPVMFIPCQAGRFWDFESFKMTDYWAKWIEAGQCIVYSVDTIDNEAWPPPAVTAAAASRTTRTGSTM